MNTNKEQGSGNKRKRGRPTLEAKIDKDAILKVALEAFAESGFEGVTITAISKRVGVRDSLLHYHFGNKNNLWQKAVIMVFEKYKEDSDNAAKLFKDLDFLSMSKALTRHFIHFTAKNPAFYQIIMHEMAQASERSKWLEDNVMSSLSNRFFKYHSEHVKLGLVHSIPIGNLTAIFLGACNTFFTLHRSMKNQFGVDVFDEKEVDQHADIVINMLYHGIVR